MARVLVSGYYGFANLGDEALLQGLIRGLRARGHEATVLSADPQGTHALHGVRAVHRYRGVLPALLAHDALLSGGGGLLQDKTSSRSLGYYLGLIRLAKLFGKKAVVFAQSIGPLSPAGERRVVKALPGVRIAVRDKASQAYLERLGLEAALTADTALLLDFDRSAGPEVQLDMPAPVLFIPRGGYPEITEGFIALARALFDTGQGVAGLALQASEDAPALREMKARLPELELLRAATPTQALSHIAGARYLVSARLHGLILAAVAHRGFSGVVYDPKVAAFLREAGRPLHEPPLDLDRLTAEIRCSEPLELARLEALKARAQRGLDWLDAVLRDE